MLLAIDVGNSNTSVGLFDRDKQLRFLASLDTDSRKTADQISIDLMNLFALYHFRFEDVTGAILCSVVPPLNFMMEKALSRLLGKPPMVVGPGVRTGLNIRLAVQSQVGADIVADAVAALEKFEPPIVTIDMGTATTIGVISEGRNYEGGMLLPGVNVSLEALSRRAAQLPAISLQHPKVLIGKTTEDCMRSGIVYGTAGMLDGVIDRIREQFVRTDTQRGGHRRQCPGDREILPEQDRLRQVPADGRAVGDLSEEQVRTMTLGASSPVVFETERLAFREMNQDDFLDLAEMLQNPKVMYAYEHDFSNSDVQQWLDRQIGRYRDYGFGLWAVISKTSGVMVGQAGLTMQPYRNKDVLEIGYLLKKEFWHCGYAREAAEGCKRYAFEQLKRDRVSSIIKSDNLASIRVADSIGMRKEDTFLTRYYSGEMLHFVLCLPRDTGAEEKEITQSG